MAPPAHCNPVPSMSSPDTPIAAPATPPPSVQPPLVGRVLPQYSFRTVVIAMTLLALAAFVYRQASLGAAWAEALVVAAAFLLACFALYAVLFLLAWIPALVGRDSWEDVGKGNPFADGQLPPQLLPPSEPKM